jgi:hypothetical protein
MHREAYAGRSLGRSAVLEVYNKRSEHHYLGNISRKFTGKNKDIPRQRFSDWDTQCD